MSRIRDAGDVIDSAPYCSDRYPIVAITGPRQSGKTTLARATFPDKPCASLKDPDVRDLDSLHRFVLMCLTKTPKRYFLDPGLAAWLAGVRSAPELAIGSLRGPLFETWVVSEFLKRHRNGLRPEELHFGRDSAGNEVDLLVTRGEEVVAAIECKSGRTVAGDCFAPLERFAAPAGASHRLLIYGGVADQPRTDAPAFGWRAIGRALDLAFA